MSMFDEAQNLPNDQSNNEKPKDDAQPDDGQSYDAAQKDAQTNDKNVDDLLNEENILDYVNKILPNLKKRAKKNPEFDAEEQEIRRLHEEIERWGRTTLPKARRIGDLLLKRKKDKEGEGKHGKWLPWLKRIEMKPTTAQTYMRLAKADKNAVDKHSTIASFLKASREGKKAEKAEERRKATGTPAPTNFDSGIVTGDSLDWLRSQPSDSVPFFVCDPPYGLGLNYDGWTEPSTAEDYWAWFKPYWQEMTRALQPGGNLLMWQSYAHMRHYWDWFGGGDGVMKIFSYGFWVRGWLMWEPIVFWTKKSDRPLKRHTGANGWLKGKEDGDTFHVGTQYKRHTERLPDHPCPKPLADCREVVKRYTLPDTLVVDPFCGLASIPLACKLEGRKYLGIERSAHYAQMGRDRIFSCKEESVSKKKPA